MRANFRTINQTQCIFSQKKSVLRKKWIFIKKWLFWRKLKLSKLIQIQRIKRLNDISSSTYDIWSCHNSASVNIKWAINLLSVSRFLISSERMRWRALIGLVIWSRWRLRLTPSVGFPNLAQALAKPKRLFTYITRRLLHSSRPSLSWGRLPHVWVHLWLDLVVQSWSGGALPRWRPPLTPSSPS